MATETLRPSAAGDQTMLFPSAVPNYGCVDETPSDEDSTYVWDDGTGWEWDLYNIPDHSEGSGTINSVKVYIRCKLQYSGYTTCICPIMKTGGTIYFGTEVDGTTSYANYSKTWAENPKTESPWTWDDIDALQIGAYIRGCFTSSGYWNRCTQVYAEVDYEEEAPPSYIPRHSGTAGVLII